MSTTRDSVLLVMSAAALIFATSLGFGLFDAYETVVPRPLPANSTTIIETTLKPNTTQLALTCLQQCAGGTCSQDTLSGATTCLTCPAGTSLEPLSGACLNTVECTTWPWCSTAEAVPLRDAHIALVTTAYIGPGPSNYTYPVTNLSSVAPFVPLFGDTNQAVVDLLNSYLLGRRTLGVASGVGSYFDDQVGAWSLSVYKSSIVPSVYVDYVLALKTRRCTRTWLPINGTCLAPPLS